MDPRDLAYFEAIAETGHLGRAAERLGRTQPALTKSVQRLEAAIGADLIQRTGRGIALTEAGQVLLERARQIRAALDDTVREVGDFAAGLAGHIRLGAGATMAEYLLPGVCSALIAVAPKVTVEIRIGMSDVLRAALRAGELDVLVGPVLVGEEQEFSTDVFGTDEVVVVAPRGHPLCGRPATLNDLAAYRWVLPTRAVAMRQWLDKVFEAQGLMGPQVQIETNSILLLPRLIAETDLLSFTSTRNLRGGRVGSHLEALMIAETTMHRNLGLVHRKTNSLSPITSRLVALLREHSARELG